MHVREEDMGRHDGMETVTPAAAALLAKIDTRQARAAEMVELRELHARAWPGRAELTSLPLTPEVLARHDRVVILTSHAAFDDAMVVDHAPLIVDTRNALGPRAGPHIFRLGAPHVELRHSGQLPGAGVPAERVG